MKKYFLFILYIISLAINPVSAREKKVLPIDTVATILNESDRMPESPLSRIYSEGNHLVLELNNDNLSPLVVEMINSLETQENVNNFEDMMKKEVIGELGGFAHSLGNMLALMNADIIIRIPLQIKPIDIVITSTDLK